MRSVNAHVTAPLNVPAPTGINTHYEIQNQLVWNDKEHTNEQHEFVYEVSWIPELGMWRQFLRTRRKT
jgi:hypothetical protein